LESTTSEFSFEHDIDGVRQAVEVRDIDYPVAQDNDYTVWSAFANHYWPALYFVDADGVIRDKHFGEGRYGWVAQAGEAVAYSGGGSQLVRFAATDLLRTRFPGS
jgi:hypothetical protein